MKNEIEWSGKDTFVALIVIMIWGVNFAPMKFGLEVLSPLELGVGRYLFAVFPLIFFIRFPRIRFRWIFLLALFQAVAQFSLLFYSMSVGMPAALASVLLQTQIFFTVFWSFIIFKHRPTKLLWASMTSAVVGLTFFTINALQGDHLSSVTGLGLLFSLGSACMWGLANVVTRQVQNETPHYSALSFIVWSSLVAVVIYLFLLMVFEPNSSRWLMAKTWQLITPKVWGSLAFLGWSSSIIGYALWTSLLKRHAANKVAPFSLGVPIIGLIVGVVWLDEIVNIWQWFGSAFVGFSLVLVVFGPRWFRRSV